jgi:hypothetical protein
MCEPRAAAVVRVAGAEPSKIDALDFSSANLSG